MEITTPDTAKKSSATFSKDCLKTDPDNDLDESGIGAHICEVCRTSFETRKGLSSHARSHLRQLGVYSSGAPIDLLYQLMKERGGTLPKPKTQAITVKKPKAQFPRLKKHNRPKIKIKISNLVKKKYALSSSSTTAVKKSAKSGHFPFTPMKPGKASSKGTAESKISKSKSGNEAVKSRLDDDGSSTSLPLASPKPLWAPQETDAPLNLTTMINSTATARDDVHVCELCGAWYETRKGLSSHARAHLRQFGVALDTKCGPIELLHKIIQTEEFQEKFSAEQEEGTSILEYCTSTPSTLLSIPKNPSLSPKRPVSMHVTPPPSKKVKIATDVAGSFTLGGKTDLKSPPQGETSKNISCEFCHEKFKKNQSLASHARGHLRQMGITEWTVHGSPMATLRTVMAQRGASSGSLKASEPLAPTSPSVQPTVPILPSSPKVNTQSSSLPVRHKVPKARKGSRTVVPKPKNEPVEVDISIIGSPKPQSEPTSPLSPQKMSAPTTVKSPVTPPKLEKQDPIQFVFCDYCGAMFETRKALSCHARAHLRQLGVKFSEKVSAIDALRELMQKEGNDRASDIKPESSTGMAVQWKKTASSPRTVTPSPVDFTKDKIGTPDITTPGFSDATCELCGFDFENRKALASHARAHLRHVGVDWKVIGSPIETLAAWMKNEPKKVADLHKRYSQGDLPLVKKGPRKPPSANHSSDSESVRMGSPKASAGQPPVSPPSKAALVPEAGREIKKEMSHSSFSQRKRPSSGEPPLSSLIQSPAAHSGLNVRSPRGFERRPSKHLSHPENISEETEPSKPSRAGNIPSLVPRPPETRLVKLVGKMYSLKCRFCEEVFHGPLSIQEDWVIHLQQHILKLKKDSTSSPQSSRRRDTLEPSLNCTEAPLLIGPQAV